MTPIEIHELNKKIAIENDLFSHEITCGPDGEFLGMAYFLNTKYLDPRDQNHFAIPLCFTRDPDKSEKILSDLIRMYFDNKELNYGNAFIKD